MNFEKQDAKERINSRSGILVIIAIAIAAYIGITNSPPANIINAWQAKINDGKYFVYLPILLIILVEMIPIFIIRSFMIFNHNKKFKDQKEMQLPYFSKL
ncbi:MAG: hypothetical protein SFU98_07090 [Leptospiraceae bacterium]|nr:hypothetical protein [Leptospiraceae bacterium]